MSPVRFWVRPPFLCPFFERRSPPNFKTSWQTVFAAVFRLPSHRPANPGCPVFAAIALRSSSRMLTHAAWRRLDPATIFVVYASPRDWFFRFHPHDPTSKTDKIPPFPLSDTAPMPRNRYLSQLFRNGVVSTPIFDTGHNALIVNTIIPARPDHYATRANGVGRA